MCILIKSKNKMTSPNSKKFITAKPVLLITRELNNEYEETESLDSYEAWEFTNKTLMIKGGQCNWFCDSLKEFCEILHEYERFSSIEERKEKELNLTVEELAKIVKESESLFKKDAGKIKDLIQ